MKKSSYPLLLVPTTQGDGVAATPKSRPRCQIGQDDPRPQFRWLRWGLIPFWAKDPAIGNRLINARSETAAEKPAFRSAMKRRRGLILADGFYEWQQQEAGKQPYDIQMRDGRPFAFAGL